MHPTADTLAIGITKRCLFSTAHQWIDNELGLAVWYDIVARKEYDSVCATFLGIELTDLKSFSPSSTAVHYITAPLPDHIPTNDGAALEEYFVECWMGQSPFGSGVPTGYFAPLFPEYDPST